MRQRRRLLWPVIGACQKESLSHRFQAGIDHNIAVVFGWSRTLTPHYYISV
jgi:hypothetical protein